MNINDASTYQDIVLVRFIIHRRVTAARRGGLACSVVQLIVPFFKDSCTREPAGFRRHGTPQKV